MRRGSSELHYIGAPFNCDGTPPEQEDPPRHLRAAGLLDRLRSTQTVRDLGALPIPAAEGIRDDHTGILNWQAWRTVTARVSRAVRESLSSDGWPLVIGGDCSILVGIMAAATAVHPRCGLFFVDGHGDFMTPASSPTGEPADMELAGLTGRAPIPLALHGGPLLRDEDVAVFGIRESDGIDSAPIHVVDCAQLRVAGLAAMSRACAASLPAELPIWLHLDVDVIDAELMPVLYPAGDGLTLDETATLLRALLGHGRVIGMDVACFHPNLDRSGAATIGLIDLLVDVLGAGSG